MQYQFQDLHLCCGIGGGAKGFQDARGEGFGSTGSFDAIFGADVDSAACQDFENLTGRKAIVMDFFTRAQYTAFHGKQPPEGWKEVTPQNIRDAAEGQYPDVVFMSPPCKGMTGLISEELSLSDKYQALNQLTLNLVKLTVEAFADDLPSFLLIENVPRIRTRGGKLLESIKEILQKKGYVFHGANHDCGELGGLGQHRKRFLFIARLVSKVPNFVYRPYRQMVKSIGKVLEHLPMPGDTHFGGPMHKIPKLAFITWLRLALIPKNKDWRFLNTLDWKRIRLAHEPRGGGAYGVQDYEKPSNTVIGNVRVNGSNGAAAIADPKLQLKSDAKANLYRIQCYEDAASCVTGAVGPSNGAVCINDPKLKEREGRHPSVYRIVSVDDPAPCVTGTRFGSGALAIADPIELDLPEEITLGCKPRSGTMGVQSWQDPSKTVTGTGDVHSGAVAVADPRIPEDHERGIYLIIARDGTWHRPLTTFELSQLQGFPTHLPDGRPFQLVGKADAKWRERIGNAVPPLAAKAIAEVILDALIASKEESILLSASEVWVSPDHYEEVDLYFSEWAVLPEEAELNFERMLN
jgi:site-specific DNA-cytosine methylase